MSRLVRIPALHAGGHGFKSHSLHASHGYMLPFYKEEENKDIEVEKQQEKEIEVQKLKEQMRLIQESQTEILALLMDPEKLTEILNAI